MKRIITLALTALCLMAATTACTKDDFKLTYDFTISGHANGEVAVAFPGGHVNLDGATELDFNYGNIDTTSLCTPKLSNRQLREINSLASDEVFSKFSASTKAGGKYYLLIDCVAKEELTGAEIRWKKVLTNEE